MFDSRKFIISLIVGSMVISGFGILDDIIVKGLIAAASALAFTIVGGMYSANLISSPADGGKARMILFTLILGFFIIVYMAIVQFFNWLFSGPLWIYIVVFGLSFILLLVRVIKNIKAKKEYVDYASNNIDIEEKNVEITITQKLEINQPIEVEHKSIRRLLLENKDKEFIYVVKRGYESPGLEYIKVNQKALNYPTLKGYFKMDHAGFFADIYYAEENIWKLHL